ncbi:MAG TPA: orotidine-5'-phosphate decarboxylase [Bacteroidetes bacterium]|jgi:orotidine-5'-phosphate decarboxylase|nr:orotidine-5'-phosphate decarboxylase [Bacteroidota bacterium]
MSFNTRLRLIQEKRNSLLCVGLDPDLRKIPKDLLVHDDPVGEFCRQIIAATSDLVCAYKLNLAFFEVLGERSWSTLHGVLASIPQGVITIGDAKRGDIGNTAEMYAQSLLGEFKFDASTVNAYMGADSVQPFAKDPEKGVFVLALTSNPGAKDFQYMRTKGKPLFEHVVAKAKKWNDNDNVGLVVGATRPVQLKRIRQLVPSMPLLIPGIGAQGGDVKSAIRHGCDAGGKMAVINVSRSVLYASSGQDFADAARSSVASLCNEMNRYRDRYF